MIHSEPPINSTTTKTPNASAMTLLVLSAAVVMCRKNHQMHADLYRCHVGPMGAM
jgi:hypothetical protein